MTVGLITEGDAEFHALPLLHSAGLVPGCPPMKPINLGGIGGEASPRAIAARVWRRVVEHWTRGIKRVLVCVDRELRKDCPGRLAGAIRRELDSLLVGYWRPGCSLSVVVADRAFEAWLLADATGLHARRVFKRRPGFTSFEGKAGERNRRGAVELESLLGRPYVKSVDAPRIFRSIEFARARTRSSSLDKLLRELGT